MKINPAAIENLFKNAVTYSKKNLPSFLVAGSIVGFWSSGIWLVKQAPKAKEEIDLKEASQNESMKPIEKAGVYAKHCWGPAVVAAGSTVMSVAAHKIDLSRLAEMVMLTRFYKDNNGKINTPLLKPDNEKEEYTEENVKNLVKEYSSTGKTLFIDKVTGVKWTGNLVDVINGIHQFNEHMNNLYKSEAKRQLPFYAKDVPFDLTVDDIDIFAKERFDVFLESIGEEPDNAMDLGIGDLLEFRCYSDGTLLKPEQILTYDKYVDPYTGVPQVCFIDYAEFLAPSSELLERYSF